MFENRVSHRATCAARRKSTMPHGKTLASAVLIVLASALTGECAAQTYPSGPLRIVVPFQPGGSTDGLGRMIAQKLNERFR